MAGSNINAGDDFIRRMETELREKQAFANGLIERAQAGERDLTDDERGLLTETRQRMEKIRDQIEQLDEISRVATEYQQRCQQVDVAIRQRRGEAASAVEYRSAGEWMMDSYKSAIGNRDARERMDTYLRAAQHVVTGDNLGVVPDPIIGPVVSFVDDARPLVSVLGTKPMPSATWHRPLVTQHTSVGAQGSTGAADKEKNELVSQKMTITRLNGTAVTYGGYVNVSRQIMDFSNPAVWDAIVTDLAAQYAVETEGALGDLINGNNNSTEATYDTVPSTGTAADSVAAAVWSAAATVYTAVKGRGSLVLAVAPDVLPLFGPLFAPYGPMNAQGTGFLANNFGQGVMGQISGIRTVMSAGLGTGEAYLLSTAAIECYEQRVGQLSIVEPSVAGTQVAYIGYFTPMVILANGVVPLVAGSL